MGIEGCLACDLADGRVPLPGGVIHETDHWLVEHTVGSLGLGTLIVKPKRHVVHAWELEDDEAAEMGSLIRDAAAVVAGLTAPDQVYVCLWSHHGGVPVHVHYVVQPVTREQVDAAGTPGPRLQVEMFEREELPPAREVEELARRARLAFARRR